MEHFFDLFHLSLNWHPHYILEIVTQTQSSLSTFESYIFVPSSITKGPFKSGKSVGAIGSSVEGVQGSIPAPGWVQGEEDGFL